MGRALQRSGKTDEAREHLKRFEYLTHNKISSAITLTYGEQGRYSVAQDVITTEPAVGPMIPVTFVPQALSSANVAKAATTGGGVCMIDVDGDGKFDIVAISESDPVVKVFRNLGEGKFKEEPSSQYGLAPKGHGVSCAVGDYDNDGKNDLAVALSDRVVLFHNDGGGKFTDVTAKVGIAMPKENYLASGMTFVDYDHDGDLDLFVTGSYVVVGGSLDRVRPNFLWRNNGNGTFTKWTAEAGFGRRGAARRAWCSPTSTMIALWTW